MQFLEIYADEHGETHMRRVEMVLVKTDYAPPSRPVGLSQVLATTTGLMLEAPSGWDPDYHATPRKQLAIVLSGRAAVTVTDGETVEVGPGSVALLNDEGSKGHRTMVLGEEGMTFFLVGLAEG
jgi:mannose-6-phosphate isomerase-like protein (cupin superfamily)